MLRRFPMLVAAATLFAVAPRPAPLAAQVRATAGAVIDGLVAVEVYVTLADDETPYYPVGRHRMAFFREGRDSVPVTTNEVGVITVLLEPGRYRLASLGDVAWKGKRYRWSQSVAVRPWMGRIALTAATGTPGIVAAASRPGGDADVRVAAAPQDDVRTPASRPAAGARPAAPPAAALAHANGSVDLRPAAVPRPAVDDERPPAVAPSPSDDARPRPERPAGARGGGSPERDIYLRVRGGVFRVEAGLGHGTGFLADTLGGLVITNDHVVAGSSIASVYIDTSTRVLAQVVARDRDADLAVLRLPAGRCAACARLALARAAPGAPIVEPGDRLLAVGFPLHQDMVLTAGIASSVRRGAIISDVNINHGNSGGPLLNMAGEAVGVNTFRDPDLGGPGVAGSVSVEKLGPLLATLPSALASLPAPEDVVLPTMPRVAYPLPLLKALADTATPLAYRFFEDRNANRFTVSIGTPTERLVQVRWAEREVTRDRKKREAKGGVAAAERYSEMAQTRDWEEYVGSETAPVVTVTIRPKLAETGASIFARALSTALVGVPGKAQFKFAGDVRDARLYRNGVEVPPLRGGHGPQRLFIENQWVSLKDVADMGYYVYPPEAFAPDSTGAPAFVTIMIKDLKNPGVLSAVDIWGETSARIWNDFAPFYAATLPGRRFVAANPRASFKVRLRCDPAAGTCVRAER